MYWRELGKLAFAKVPVDHVNRGVYKVKLSSDSDFEYYIEAVMKNDKSLRFPPAAPKLNQTVVLVPVENKT